MRVENAPRHSTISFTNLKQIRYFIFLVKIKYPEPNAGSVSVKTSSETSVCFAEILPSSHSVVRTKKKIFNEYL